jgi:hypothetical protein
MENIIIKADEGMKFDAIYKHSQHGHSFNDDFTEFTLHTENGISDIDYQNLEYYLKSRQIPIKQGILLQEDECAPDSRVEFNRKLKLQTGSLIEDFMKKGLRAEQSHEIQYALGVWVISISLDDPFWKLKCSVK